MRRDTARVDGEEASRVGGEAVRVGKRHPGWVGRAFRGGKRHPGWVGEAASVCVCGWKAASVGGGGSRRVGERHDHSQKMGCKPYWCITVASSCSSLPTLYY